MGSLFYGRVLRAASDSYDENQDFRAFIDRHAERAHAGLRLLGSLHYRALSDALGLAAHFPSTDGDGDAEATWSAGLADFESRRAEYERLMQRTVQTNEVARAFPLFAGLLWLHRRAPLPIRLYECGSSAGLLLRLDRYRYECASQIGGANGSILTLRNRTASGAPDLSGGIPSIVERRGCDLHPLDARNDDDARTLLSFVWPDQRERFSRLQTALEIAKANPVVIERAGAPEWMQRCVQPRDGTLTVLMHSVLTEHLDAQTNAALLSAVEGAGAHAHAGAPFAWLRMEKEGGIYYTRATLWPHREEALIATSDGHAQNLRWETPPS